MKIDLSNQNLKKLEAAYLNDYLRLSDDLDSSEPTRHGTVHTVVLDNNSLSKLENLDKFIYLKHV